MANRKRLDSKSEDTPIWGGFSVWFWTTHLPVQHPWQMLSKSLLIFCIRTVPDIEDHGLGVWHLEVYQLAVGDDVDFAAWCPTFDFVFRHFLAREPAINQSCPGLSFPIYKVGQMRTTLEDCFQSYRLMSAWHKCSCCYCFNCRSCYCYYQW